MGFSPPGCCWWNALASLKGQTTSSSSSSSHHHHDGKTLLPGRGRRRCFLCLRFVSVFIFPSAFASLHLAHSFAFSQPLPLVLPAFPSVAVRSLVANKKKMGKKWGKKGWPLHRGIEKGVKTLTVGG